MSVAAKLALLAAFFFLSVAFDASADKKTVCTITVNSPDEKEIFRRNLPQDEFQFVELVERGRPDWLASACRAGVSCDVLLISGHFDGGTEFYTDRLDAREFLPVDEMGARRVRRLVPGPVLATEGGLPFGCKTLNAEAMRSASAEIGRVWSAPGIRRRRRTPVARAERAPRRKQSRSHAPHLQGRSGDLRLFLEGAARQDGGPDPRALFSIRRARSGVRTSAKLLSSSPPAR
jgi:hypothetical protein